MENQLAIIALNSAKKFSNLVCEEVNKILKYEKKSYRLNLTPSTEITFANDEVKLVIDESIRGKDVYIIQLMDDPLSSKSINDNIIALSTAINAALYGDPYQITAVIPQYPYSRQDKRRAREGITAKLFGNLLEISGAQKLITLDVHSEAILGFFDKLQIENLHISRTLITYFNVNFSNYKKNLTVVSPDVGSAKKGLFFAKNLKVDLAIIEKVRNYSKESTIDNMRLVGNVKDKNVLLADDMIATGNTLLNACELLKEKGAHQVFITTSLPFFSNKSYQKFDKAFEKGIFNQVIGTNAVFWGNDFIKDHPWYKELDCTPLFAKVIYNINQKKSVSSLLK